MKKAELEKKLEVAEAELKAIIEVCRKSGEDIIREYNEDSIKNVGKPLFDMDSVYPIKVGEIESKAIWAIAAIRGISPLDDEWEAI